jgi:hypothetical protein
MASMNETYDAKAQEQDERRAMQTIELGTSQIERELRTNRCPASEYGHLEPEPVRQKDAELGLESGDHEQPLFAGVSAQTEG